MKGHEVGKGMCGEDKGGSLNGKIVGKYDQDILCPYVKFSDIELKI